MRALRGLLLLTTLAGVAAFRAPSSTARSARRAGARVLAPPLGLSTVESCGFLKSNAMRRPRAGGRLTSSARESDLDFSRLPFASLARQAQRLPYEFYNSDSRILVNTILVAIVLGFCAFELLTVDSSLWRGWSVQEVALRLLPDNWAAYEGAVSATPILSKSLLNFGTYCIGDWIAQMAQQKQEHGDEMPFRPLDFDLPRVVRNGLIGASLGPMCHYYYDFSEWIFPSDPDWHKPFKVLGDQTVWALTWNAAYCFLLMLSKGGSVQEAWLDTKQKAWPLLKAGWKLWPAAHIVTYGVVPTRHRLLWVDMVDLVWCSILAGMGNTHGEEPEPKTVEEAFSLAEEAEEPEQEETATAAAASSDGDVRELQKM